MLYNFNFSSITLATSLFHHHISLSWVSLRSSTYIISHLQHTILQAFPHALNIIMNPLCFRGSYSAYLPLSIVKPEICLQVPLSFFHKLVQLHHTTSNL